MSLKEFKDNIQKKNSKHPAKIKNSFGVYDCYKQLRKEGWMGIGRPLTEHEFYSIIRGVNKCLAENIANGQEVFFPFKMGKLELHKFKRGASIVNGKLKITYPVDWDSTIKLWYEDAECYRNKVLLRMEEPYVFKVKYNKYHANYNNKLFYEFSLNSFIKSALKDNIKKGKIDALW